MADAPVLTTVDGPVGWLTLNRPEAMNAVTVELARELEAGLRRLAGEAAVIVIRGAGGNFSAGGDVAEVDRLRGEGPAALAELFEAFGRALATIAEINNALCAARCSTQLAGMETEEFVVRELLLTTLQQIDRAAEAIRRLAASPSR